MTTSIPHPAPPSAHDESPTGFQAVVRALKDRQFMVAAVLLGITAVAWPFTLSALKWVQEKTPVAWPKGTYDGRPWAVEVSEDFRWINMPTRFGKYIQGTPYPKFNGEIVLPVDIRDTLGVGRYEDAPRRATRSSNWYVSRIYEDPTQPANTAFRYWQLDVTYYTGSAEKVEHVPDRCMVAGGYVPSGDRGTITCAYSGPRGDWPSSQEFVRAGFVMTGKNATAQGCEVVEYYTFILNGKNETSWERIRLHMATTPWEKHCYFAKIQFTPLALAGGQLKASLVSDLGACDRAAQAFVNAFLPDVLRALPPSAKIDELNNGRNHR